MTLIEYGYVGFFGGLTGIILSLVSSWVLTKYFFEINFSPNYMGLIGLLTLVVSLTMFVGWWNTRDVVRSSPLEVLRREN